MKTIIVLMTIICSVVGKNGDLKVAWKLQRKISLENCLTMNSVLSVNGTKGVITVRCQPITTNK